MASLLLSKDPLTDAMAAHFEHMAILARNSLTAATGKQWLRVNVSECSCVKLFATLCASLWFSFKTTPKDFRLNQYYTLKQYMCIFIFTDIFLYRYIFRYTMCLCLCLSVCVFVFEYPFEFGNKTTWVGVKGSVLIPMQRGTSLRSQGIGRTLVKPHS